MSRKYIESGWQSYLEGVMPADAPEIQIRECRQAFYAGAAVLMQSIKAGLDSGSEPTEADIRRMSDIHAELDVFGAEIDKRYLKPREQ